MKYTEIDVRELAPPEPMTAILSALSSLPQGEVLLVHHSRQPFPLYDKLIAAGWAYQCEQKADDYFLLSIFCQKDQ